MTTLQIVPITTRGLKYDNIHTVSLNTVKHMLMHMSYFNYVPFSMLWSNECSEFKSWLFENKIIQCDNAPIRNGYVKGPEWDNFEAEVLQL